MIRFLFILLLAYLLYRLIRIFFVVLFTGRKKRDEFSEPEPEPTRKKKIIDKDEGEYVDFEELDNDKK
jgi:hypothetical protein